MIKRRFLMSAMLGAVLAAPAASVAQTASKTYRIGVLGFYPLTATWSGWNAFIKDLRHRGYDEGRNLVFEGRSFGGDPDRVNELAAELVVQRPDIIVTTGGMVAALAGRNRGAANGKR